MPFLSELQTTKVGNNRWRLDSPLLYSSRRYGALIRAERGFVMDYASVPRLPIVYLLTGNTGHKAAVIHDWIYRTGHGKWTRKQADLIFLDGLLEAEPRWRAYSMYAGVRAFAWLPWRRYASAFAA